MINILVTGANGQLGNELRVLAALHPHLQYTYSDRAELDITNLDDVLAFFAEKNFAYCINCAAYTAVDKAEQEQELSFAINARGAAHLAQACAAHQATLIHISSDYVYHNTLNRPLQEEDPTTPQGIYAQSKLEGDELAIRHNPNTLVLRTSWVYSSFGHNFVKTMLKLGTERPELRIVYDQVGAPTYAADLAQVIVELIHSGKAKSNSGIYNYSNEGVTSWYDFARAIFAWSGIACRVLPIESKDYPTPASRPHYSLLNKAKFKTTFGLEIPHWQDSLIACLTLLGAKK
jgi:dTDP-4-dehydrorhamnose reductase